MPINQGRFIMKYLKISLFIIFISWGISILDPCCYTISNIINTFLFYTFINAIIYIYILPNSKVCIIICNNI